MQEKALKTIQKVGREKDFKYVFGSTPVSGLLMTEGTDLMEAVKKEIGIN
ncbi:hypothetical protein [Winogradskyella sp.]